MFQIHAKSNTTDIPWTDAAKERNAAIQDITGSTISTDYIK